MTRARWKKREGQRIWAATADRCNCLAYHFPHRKHSGACVYGGKADYYQAMRAGIPQPEAMQLLSVNQLEQLFPLPRLNLLQPNSTGGT